jgi:uncharacterized protein YkwD
MKKIVKTLLLAMLIVALIIAIPIKHETRLISSTREKPEGVIIILDNPIPLSDGTEQSLTYAVFQEINFYRNRQGLKPLIWAEDLASAAEIRAEECELSWSHTRPNGEPWYTVNQSIMYGENLAKHYSNPTELLTAWIESPAHNENLVDAEYKYCGIGEYNGYIACEFCY